MKNCNQCKQPITPEKELKHRYSLSGIANICKPCEAARCIAKYYRLNYNARRPRGGVRP